MWDYPDVQKLSISFNHEYDVWIIVRYPFWIILATIFFNTVCIDSLHYSAKEKGKWFKHEHKYTETLTRLNREMISFKGGVDVIHYFCHVIEANTCRIT